MEREHWFTLQVVSGKESKVKQTLEKHIVKDDKPGILKIVAPVRMVTRPGRGKKPQLVAENLTPGYVFLKIRMGTLADYNRAVGLKEVAEGDSRVLRVTAETQRLVLDAADAGALKFLMTGPDKAPLPMLPDEIDPFLAYLERSQETPSLKFTVGENVIVQEGPFNGFQGVVQEVDLDKSKMKVEVSIFGRVTPLELSYGQVRNLTQDDKK